MRQFAVSSYTTENINVTIITRKLTKNIEKKEIHLKKLELLFSNTIFDPILLDQLRKIQTHETCGYIKIRSHVILVQDRQIVMISR